MKAVGCFGATYTDYQGVCCNLAVIPARCGSTVLVAAQPPDESRPSRPQNTKRRNHESSCCLFTEPPVLAHPSSVSCHGAGADPIAFPIKVAEGKRTFADAKGRPFFWLGTTQWELFRGYELEDARIILAKTRENGFTVVQVKLLGQGDGNRANVYGHKPLLNGDALTPNEEYFKNVDAVVKAARDNNLVILMTVFHQSWRNNIPFDKARAWAKWLATRYAAAPNVIWSTTPEAKQESVPILREIAAGLREGDPLRRPISFKPDPAGPSSSFINEEPWLDFNAMQVWNALEKIYPMLTADYGLKPVKPTLMAEGAYEAGEEYGFAVTPLWVRRQAYYSYLAGGHHTYGHNDSWRILPTWKQSLDAPGAADGDPPEDLRSPFGMVAAGAGPIPLRHRRPHGGPSASARRPPSRRPMGDVLPRRPGRILE